MKILASSVVRLAQKGNSHGHLYVIDTDTAKVKQIFNHDDHSISFEGRGGDRGLRGIAFYNNQIIVGSGSKLFFFDKNFDRDELLLNGFMPRIYDQNQEPTALYRNYLHTYVERDVRQLILLKDLTRFENFIRLLAGRTGQVVNVASLASDTGVSSPTISDWLSVLEASYIIYRLQPYYHNLGKRIIKSPKLYFVDVGLASYLLGIESVRQIARDPLLGGLFENMVVMDAVKTRYNAGKDANLYYFRDNHKNEVDLLYKSGQKLVPIEIKASRTYNTDFHKGISHFFKIKGADTNGHIIYAGEKTMNINNIQIHHFKNSREIFSETE